MTTNLAKWVSNNGQITKSGLSDGCRTEFLPSVTGFDYDWLRFKRYLGNVGLFHRLVASRDLIWIKGKNEFFR